MERRPGWYTWVALMLTAVLSPVVSVYAAVNIAQRSNCDLYRTQIAVYQEEPPTTATGIKLQEAYEKKLRSDCGWKG